MPGTSFIDHKGERLLLVDFSNAFDDQEIAEAAEEAMKLVRSTNQRRSVRGLIDLSGTPMNKAVRETLKKMSRNNGPYMKSVAFVGLGPVLSAIITGFLSVTRRSNHRVFRSRGEALDWLAKS
jgi:hypothetical protein